MLDLRLRTNTPTPLPQIRALRKRVQPVTTEKREFLWLVHGLEQIAEALAELLQKHGAAPSNEPAVIWQPDICSATDPKFWLIW
jgi:hypothetical protein